MDLTQFSEEELQSMFNMGSFAAGQELANRRNAGNTMQDMTPLERENINEAIRRNIELDTQGNIISFDLPEEDDDAYSDSELMESDTTSSRGILDLIKDYVTGGGMIGMVGRGITSLGNTIGDAFKGSRFYNPRTASGNRLFAPGARIGDPVGLQMRRDAASISRMLNRLSQGKKIGVNRLANLQAKFGLENIDVGGMAKSIAESAKTGYGGYGSSDAAAAGAAATGGRDYSSSPGAMAGDMEYDEE
tara:strand:+ start:25 stop:765 length:741 start_codon:yes stop_codon:yes gene_type:complete